MSTINVTGALWYISETSIPGSSRIRVFDFGYGPGTVCQIEGGTTLNPEITIQMARLGTAFVYVPLDTPKRSYVYMPDDSAFKAAFSAVIIVGVLLALIGK